MVRRLTCLKPALFILFFCVVGFYSSVSFSTAQSSYISSSTQVVTVFSTNTILTTITNRTISYSTTIQTLNLTAQGTQTVTQTSVTTVTSSYTAVLGGTLTQTTTFVVTQFSSQTTSLLGNIWGESLALILLLGAITSFIVPRVHSPHPKGSICKECGFHNPPFARAFCVKCGHSLTQSDKDGTG